MCLWERERCKITWFCPLRFSFFYFVILLFILVQLSQCFPLLPPTPPAHPSHPQSNSLDFFSFGELIFFLLICRYSLYIKDIKLQPVLYVANIFSWFVNYVSVFFMVSLALLCRWIWQSSLMASVWGHVCRSQRRPFIECRCFSSATRCPKYCTFILLVLLLSSCLSIVIPIL